MNQFDSENCFTLALYGTAYDSANITPLISDVVELFRSAGQPPSHLNVRAPGFSERPLLFARAWRRLQKTDPEGVKSVGVRSLIDDWHTLGDWTTVCCVEYDWSCLSLSAGVATMPDAEPQLKRFVQRWLSKIRPAYGIGFWRQRGLGPVAYTIGLAYGHDVVYEGPQYEENLAICRWSDGMSEAVYDEGILRDVYPYSLLTARHLQRDIDGRPLWAWIQKTSQRGQLAPFDDSGDYTLWTVAPEHLPTVRRQLAAAGGLYVLDRENHLT